MACQETSLIQSAMKNRVRTAFFNLIIRDIKNRSPGMREVVRDACVTPDDLCLLYNMYHDTPGNEKGLSCRQLRLGMKEAFEKFTPVQVSFHIDMYRVKLRDMMFLLHPKPRNEEQARLFKSLTKVQKS